MGKDVQHLCEGGVATLERPRDGKRRSFFSASAGAPLLAYTPGTTGRQADRVTVRLSFYCCRLGAPSRRRALGAIIKRQQLPLPVYPHPSPNHDRHNSILFSSALQRQQPPPPPPPPLQLRQAPHPRVQRVQLSSARARRLAGIFFPY